VSGSTYAARRVEAPAETQLKSVAVNASPEATRGEQQHEG